MPILRHENDARFSEESAYSPTCSWSTSLVTCQRRDILRHVVRIQPNLTFLCCQIALGDSFGGFGPICQRLTRQIIRPFLSYELLRTALILLSDVATIGTSDNACWLVSNSLITLHNVHYQYLISDLENLLNFAQLPNAFTLKTGSNCSNLHLPKLKKLISLRLFQHHLFL